MPVEGTWDLTVSTPIGRINAVAELLRQDGVLTGTSKAGRLPASKVTGRRRTTGVPADAEPRP
ncbi:hypothetical protein [Streptomyces sp. AP-93]|uniref:hypothetical protein n=1 Tax=Streptomyces sp. AP-93 TaxID=2929048 RepID=UPI001FB003C6|nr:hypothetical protein [Streptomyces sp. AP-93]MCJ0875463.1 hypothetical protein [Streptomyces sp. AP-93]